MCFCPLCLGLNYETKFVKNVVMVVEGHLLVYVLICTPFHIRWALYPSYKSRHLDQQ